MAENEKLKTPGKSRKPRTKSQGQGFSSTMKIPKVEIEANRDAVRRAAIEKSQKPVSGLDLFMKLLPVWALVGVILFVAPTLPLRAVGQLFSGAADLFSGSSEPRYRVGRNEPFFIVSESELPPEVASLPEPNWSLEISSVFTEEVQFWEEAIGAWSLTYRVKPNLIATVMQIESCGNPQAVSGAGASGLFQVMPFHFEEGEDHFDPNTNAKRGMIFLATLLADANGDVALALAAYNGGGTMLQTSPAAWPEETKNYQFWGSGIYEEAELGFDQSPTLQQWKAAGGQALCSSAATELGLYE